MIIFRRVSGWHLLVKARKQVWVLSITLRMCYCMWSRICIHPCTGAEHINCNDAFWPFSFAISWMGKFKQVAVSIAMQNCLQTAITPSYAFMFWHLGNQLPTRLPCFPSAFLFVCHSYSAYICPQTKIHIVHAAYIGLERSYLYIKIHNIPPLARLRAMPAATHNDAVFSDLMRLIRMWICIYIYVYCISWSVMILLHYNSERFNDSQLQVRIRITGAPGQHAG